MKDRLVLAVIVLILFCAPFGCRSYQGEAPKEYDAMLQKIYIDEVEPRDEVIAGQDVEIKVAGNLPSPAYTFARFDVRVRGKVIEITPLASHDASKMVAQVLVPFEQVCKVENLRPGTYEVKVFGRGETVSVKQSIKVRK